MPLYLYLLLGSLIIPLLFSFFAIDFIRYRKHFAISTTIVAIIFLIWDVLFTSLGIWGFNDSYCLGLNILHLPIEEILFFFVIPFCSLFTHFALLYAYPNLSLNKKATYYLSIFLIIIATIIIASNLSRAYTVVSFSFFIGVLIIGLRYHLKLLQQFSISFFVILIPFFIVNGILTGALTDTPIVWYNNLENLGIRIYTIPIEDVGYAFSMLFGNLLIFERLNKF